MENSIDVRKKGIDISEHNGIINFEEVKDQVDFIMIRATYGRKGIDKMFKRNAEECKRLKIPFGFYLYSYALNEEQAKDEISLFLKTISDYKTDVLMPCAVDMEDADGYKAKNGNPKNETLVNILVYECNQLAMAGFLPIIYASASWWQNKLNDKKLENVLKWCAWWNVSEEKIDKDKYSIWQQTSKKKLKGINGNVDFNISFKDFEGFITYTSRYLKICYIKEIAGLNDLEIQFVRLYKYGHDLIIKIYERLKKAKIKKQDLSYNEICQLLLQEYGIEVQTINYLKAFYRHEDLINKLYNGICEGD